MPQLQLLMLEPLSLSLSGWDEAALLFRLINHTNHNVRRSHDHNLTFLKMPSFIYFIAKQTNLLGKLNCNVQSFNSQRHNNEIIEITTTRYD